MPPIGSNYNPGNVLFGRPPSGGPIVRGPYVFNGPGAAPQAPAQNAPGQGGTPPAYSGAPAQKTVPAGASASTGNILGPESVRATGTGPYDAAYRQNLATYAGGQFARPGGAMSFNPTSPSTFPGMATGGGTAPVTGMPASLMDMALGGQGFSWTPPVQPAQPNSNTPYYPDMRFWMDQYMRNGRGQRMGSFA